MSMQTHALLEIIVNHLEFCISVPETPIQNLYQLTLIQEIIIDKYITLIPDVILYTNMILITYINGREAYMRILKAVHKIFNDQLKMHKIECHYYHKDYLEIVKEMLKQIFYKSIQIDFNKYSNRLRSIKKV